MAIESLAITEFQIQLGSIRFILFKRIIRPLQLYPQHFAYKRASQQRCTFKHLIMAATAAPIQLQRVKLRDKKANKYAPYYPHNLQILRANNASNYWINRS